MAEGLWMILLMFLTVNLYVIKIFKMLAIIGTFHENNSSNFSITIWWKGIYVVQCFHQHSLFGHCLNVFSFFLFSFFCALVSICLFIGLTFTCVVLMLVTSFLRRYEISTLKLLSRLIQFYHLFGSLSPFFLIS